MRIRKVRGVLLDHPDPEFQAEEAVVSWKGLVSPPHCPAQGKVRAGEGAAIRILAGLALVTSLAFSHPKPDTGQKRRSG